MQQHCWLECERQGGKGKRLPSFFAGHKPLIALEELGVKYELHKVTHRAG